MSPRKMDQISHLQLLRQIGLDRDLSDELIDQLAAIASTDVQVIGFDSDQVRQLCDDNHEIGYRFLESVAEALSRRLVATRLQLLDLFE